MSKLVPGIGEVSHICAICGAYDRPDLKFVTEEFWICPECIKEIRKNIGRCPECGGKGTMCGFGTRSDPSGNYAITEYESFECKRCQTVWDKEVTK